MSRGEIDSEKGGAPCSLAVLGDIRGVVAQLDSNYGYASLLPLLDPQKSDHACASGFEIYIRVMPTRSTYKGMKRTRLALLGRGVSKVI